MTYANLLVLCPCGEELAVRTETDAANIKVPCFSGSFIHEDTRNPISQQRS
jgi:hypothetical protein